MDLTEDLLTFLSNSPTAWHAIHEVKKRFLKAGMSELKENDAWKIKKGEAYFVDREGSSLIAFKVPTRNPLSASVMASHTDSPALKLKPHADYIKENMAMLGLEIYGSPILSSWLNRDLGIAGKISTLNRREVIEEHLIRLEEFPVVIPQLAIHLDRKVNEEGPLLNKQEHLAALIGMGGQEKGFLEQILKRQLGFTKLLAHDLFLYPLEKAKLIGYKNEMIAGYRLDSLASVHAIQDVFIKAKNSPEELKMIAFWDHEEIGSRTAKGASSPFFKTIFERILLSLGLDRETYFRILSRSLCLSVDLAHALHPNYPEKHEPRHQIFLNQGVVLKTHAQHSYASTSSSSAKLIQAALKSKIPLQKFVTRGDISAGSTVGPIHATVTGMPTVDIGIPQLSMHSAREIIGTQDHLMLCKLLQALIK